MYRHERVAPPSGGVAQADDEAIATHLATVFGDGPAWVFHEIISDRVHIDVHILPATATRDYTVLCTSGMSALPMTMPDEMEHAEDWQFGELCMVLPPDWPVTGDEASREENYWPIRLLKGLARLPHDYATFLGWGHTVPNGDPAKPYVEGSALCGALLVPPLWDVDDLFVLERPDEDPIHFFQVLPLTEDEMEFKLAHGVEALLVRMEEHDPSVFGTLDPARTSLVG